MRQVQIESPFAGDVEANVAYARMAMRDSLKRGEAPYASHLLYTQPGVLDDNDPDERKHGIEAGLVFAEKADASVFYVDRGISSGMRWGLKHAISCGRDVIVRSFSSPFGTFDLDVARELNAREFFAAIGVDL